MCFRRCSGRGQRPWRLKFRGYQHEDILTQTVKTDKEGVAQLNFTPEREGYYRVAWQSSQGVDAEARSVPAADQSRNLRVCCD